MTIADIDNLFEYLAIHFEKNPKVHSKRQKNAWLELLEPFSPEDVKAALLQCLREKRYFPDAQEVAVRCAKAVPAQTPPSTPLQPDDTSIIEFHTTYRRLKEEGKI